MDELFKNIPCRENQLIELFELFGEDDEPLPCSIFISGNMATGKSLCIESALNYLDYQHVIINCIECYSPKIMYETILSQLMSENDETKCETLRDFVNILSSYNSDENGYKPIVLVFDKAERLRNMDQTIFSTLLRLRELVKLNICTIFISNLVFNSFFFKMGVRVPFRIYFPNYNKEELFKIIFLSHQSFVRHVLKDTVIHDELKQEIAQPELFANFLNAFLSVFYRPCRDLLELQHMAKVNFVKYCEPIIKEEISPSDQLKLWRQISPLLKSNLELLYLRISSTKQPTLSPGKENKLTSQPTFINMLKEELTSTKTFAQSFELPFYAKYLLISAYLASYNPPKEDKRLFMKNHGKQRKRLQQVKAKAKISEKLNTQLGPKVFTLDRLLAIFYAILEDKIGLTSNLLAQIATLVELKLIAGNKEVDLDTAKYKCIVGYDFISAVAQTVGFNVRKYLYDFI